MISLKLFLALLPLILSVSARPSAGSSLFKRQDEHTCYAPNNCGAPIGDCLWCCMVTPNNAPEFCHQDGNTACGAQNEGKFWHCEEHDHDHEEKKFKA